MSNIQKVPSLVPKPGSPTVTQGKLPCQKSTRIRHGGLSQAAHGREICLLKIRVSGVRLTRIGSGRFSPSLRSGRSALLIRFANRSTSGHQTPGQVELIPTFGGCISFRQTPPRYRETNGARNHRTAGVSRLCRSEKLASDTTRPRIKSGCLDYRRLILNQ